jgi:hypothetical protein
MKLGFAIAVVLTSAASAATPTERLNKLDVPGFVLGFEGTDDKVGLREYVPAGEKVDNWTRMLTEMRLIGAARYAPPGRLGQLVVEGLTKGCPGAKASPIREFQIDGRPAMQVRGDCPKLERTGKPETFFMLVIGGNEDTFSRQVAFRHYPSAEEAKWAEGILSRTRICAADSGAPDC